MEPSIVRYVPGQRINTRKILEIVGGLSLAEWRFVVKAYPELASAGLDAPFRSAENITIFSPSYVSMKLLGLLLGASDGAHLVYPYPNRSRPTSVLIHVRGGYASLHIFRLRPPTSQMG
jgi:hypothetical protein